MCRKCHRTAAQCGAAVCTYIACSRPQKFCEHLHARQDAMKTSSPEASALQTAGSFSLALPTSHAISLESTFPGYVGLGIRMKRIGLLLTLNVLLIVLLLKATSR